MKNLVQLMASRAVWLAVSAVAVAAAVTGASGIVAVAMAGDAAAVPTVKTVQGTVGPGFTIDLKLGSKKVTKLRAGVPYRFAIQDRSAVHDFHLTGPRVNRVITGVGFMGTKSIVLRLKRGTYRFLCDPHASSMRGSFRVA